MIASRISVFAYVSEWLCICCLSLLFLPNKKVVHIFCFPYIRKTGTDGGRERLLAVQAGHCLSSPSSTSPRPMYFEVNFTWCVTTFFAIADGCSYLLLKIEALGWSIISILSLSYRVVLDIRCAESTLVQYSFYRFDKKIFVWYVWDSVRASWICSRKKWQSGWHGHSVRHVVKT